MTRWAAFAIVCLLAYGGVSTCVDSLIEEATEVRELATDRLDRLSSRHPRRSSP